MRRRPRSPARFPGFVLLVGAVLGAMLGAAPGAMRSLLLGRATAWAATDAVGAPLGAARVPGPPRPRVGQKAPAFVLKTLDGGAQQSLDGLVGGAESRGVVLVFVSCRCPYVAQARQPLGELFKQYGGKVAFAGINANQNESADDAKADAAQSFSFPILRDEGAKVADLYAAERTPEVFLIDAKGVIRYHGGIVDLGPALDDFTAGRAIVKAEAKAFGCTIKRKT